MLCDHSAVHRSISSISPTNSSWNISLWSLSFLEFIIETQFNAEKLSSESLDWVKVLSNFGNKTWTPATDCFNKRYEESLVWFFGQVSVLDLPSCANCIGHKVIFERCELYVLFIDTFDYATCSYAWVVFKWMFLWINTLKRIGYLRKKE